MNLKYLPPLKDLGHLGDPLVVKIQEHIIHDGLILFEVAVASIDDSRLGLLVILYICGVDLRELGVDEELSFPHSDHNCKLYDYFLLDADAYQGLHPSYLKLLDEICERYAFIRLCIRYGSGNSPRLCGIDFTEEISSMRELLNCTTCASSPRTPPEYAPSNPCC